MFIWTLDDIIGLTFLVVIIVLFGVIYILEKLS